MDMVTTTLFYGVVGIAVAIAVALRDRESLPATRLFQVISAALFWPVYLPWLLHARAEVMPSDAELLGREAESPRGVACADSIGQAIRQVEVELEAALRSLDGWAESALEGAEVRLSELRAAWHAQADRIRELDRLLAESNMADNPLAGAQECCGEDGGGAERVQQAEQARSANLSRLKGVRRQLYRDLMGTLAWVRELVTMIHLARYTGAPASRAHELVTQMAAAIEGLSEVSEWHCEAAS